MTRDLKAPEIGLVIEMIGNYLLKRKTNYSLYSIIFVIKFIKNFFTENLIDMKEKDEEVEAVVIVDLLIVIGIEVSLL